MNRKISRADFALARLREEMHRIGYQDAKVLGMPSPILYEATGELARFYQPDVMVRRGYLRLSGSVGFALGDPAINGNLAIAEALNPKSGCMISVRLENFLPVMKQGVIESDEMVEIAPFVEKLAQCLEDNVPKTIFDAERMLSDARTWVSMLLQHSAGGQAVSPFSRVASVLMAASLRRRGPEHDRGAG